MTAKAEGNGHGAPAKEATSALTSCFAYSFLSISMVLSNKSLAATYQADLEVLPVVFQCVVAVVLVEGARRLGYVSYEPFNWQTALQWLPVNVFFCSMLYSGFMALRYMNVPIVTVFKNLTNILVVWGDWYINSQKVSILIVGSLAVTTGGAVMAACNDIQFSPWGYFWMCANCVSCAGYVLYMKFATKSIKLPKFGMVFYNNLLGMCLLTPAALMRGEMHELLANQSLHSMGYAGLNFFAGCVGFMLNFASLWCVSATSATTYAIVGAMNKVPTSVLGYFMFKSPISRETAIYICVSILGGLMYSMAKIREQRQRDKEPKAAPTAEMASLMGNGQNGANKV